MFAWGAARAPSPVTPYAVFRSESVAVVSDQTQGEHRSLVLDVTGPFTVKGESHPLQARVDVAIEGDEATVATQFDISLKNHGIKPPSLIGIKVADIIPVKVALVFRLDGPGIVEDPAGPVEEIPDKPSGLPEEPVSGSD